MAACERPCSGGLAGPAASMQAGHEQARAVSRAEVGRSSGTSRSLMPRLAAGCVCMNRSTERGNGGRHQLLCSEVCSLVEATTSGSTCVRGSMTAMMSAAAPPGAAGHGVCQCHRLVYARPACSIMRHK